MIHILFDLLKQLFISGFIKVAKIFHSVITKGNFASIDYIIFFSLNNLLGTRDEIMLKCILKNKFQFSHWHSIF